VARVEGYRTCIEWLVCGRCRQDYRVKGDPHMCVILLVPLGMRLDQTRCECGQLLVQDVTGVTGM
jgi:hypothetical protein